jgi:DNA-binding response OmpR family regulator
MTETKGIRGRKYRLESVGRGRGALTGKERRKMMHLMVTDDGDGSRSMLLRRELAATGQRVEAVRSPSAVPETGDGAAVLVAWLRGRDPAVQVAKIRAGWQRPIIAIVPGFESAFLTTVDLYGAGIDDCLLEPLDATRLLAAAHWLADLPSAAADLPPVTGTLLPIEQRILVELVRHPGQPMTCQQLADLIWGTGHHDGEAVLRVFVHLVGRKLAEPDRLVTRPWVQYR